MILFEPKDIPRAYVIWKATCGPAAFAAVTRRPVMTCRSFFPSFPAITWCNPSAMLVALRTAGIPHKKTAVVNDAGELPAYGLAFIQIGGSWCRPNVPVGAAYRRTHWIGYAVGKVGESSSVYDINIERWIPVAEWRETVLPALVAHHKGDGTWSVRQGIEVMV